MFSAVSNLGAGGTQDVSLSDTSNGVLYGMFAVTGLIAGGINNCEFDSSFHCQRSSGCRGGSRMSGIRGRGIEARS